MAKVTIVEGNDWGTPDKQFERIIVGKTIKEIKDHIKDVLCSGYYTYPKFYDIYDLNVINGVVDINILDSIEDNYSGSVYE
jgi:hypothetical protein